MSDTTTDTVLVTGAAGFIGSHLCEALLARGHRVMAVDNLSTGDVAHLERLLGHKGFTFSKRDVGLEPTPEMSDAGRIFNLACPASPAHYQQWPVDTVLSSVLGAWRLLELARASGARLLHTSTSEVYGDPQQHPQREDYWGHVNPNGARSCYDEGKRCAEAMLMAWRQQHGVDVTMARIFNTYGPRLSPGDGRVVSNFIVQALQGDDLTVYGDGQQTRSFCYVDDTLRGLLALMDSSEIGPINIGNPGEHTMLQLAEMVLRLTGSRARLVFKPLPQDDPRRRCPDISLARERLGWQPEVALEDGLQRTIHHFRGLLGARRVTVA
ncbi:MULTISPECIES: UDP-glucuronic acid decarboxylase family protein [unclassified Roseateles]|uniref:UDP-glucuronic acid decarboxylase family protein n=1 Tax=unclassified Roseateles TaxID=2626991 RepID=UPI0006F7E0E5|nr:MULTISPECIES: UDP-glucuronic acid decarboxylase family protein [unclassified Roseateles]KQW43257.1 NAD-dependent dehydratase [Pelomonas sp. Root405]KRA70995.1 NAD-dependent dehydratase [Pelomonas sp. Root662]